MFRFIQRAHGLSCTTIRVSHTFPRKSVRCFLGVVPGRMSYAILKGQRKPYNVRELAWTVATRHLVQHGLTDTSSAVNACMIHLAPLLWALLVCNSRGRALRLRLVALPITCPILLHDIEFERPTALRVPLDCN
jgi:hypothetical protein